MFVVSLPDGCANIADCTTNCPSGILKLCLILRHPSRAPLSCWAHRTYLWIGVAGDTCLRWGVWCQMVMMIMKMILLTVGLCFSNARLVFYFNNNNKRKTTICLFLPESTTFHLYVSVAMMLSNDTQQLPTDRDPSGILLGGTTLKDMLLWCFILFSDRVKCCCHDLFPIIDLFPSADQDYKKNHERGPTACFI